MSDFAQPGLICTLQRLNESHLEWVEGQLTELAAEKPVALVLPCHGADLERPAVRHIAAELREARFLGELVVSVNGVDEAGFERARALFEAVELPQTWLWNDRPGTGGTAAMGGKGGNVDAALRHLLAAGRCAVIATQDCDVASFQRRDLARLCLAVAHPGLSYRFAKMYYSRVTDRLYGRVSRLFLAPLLQALVRVAGHQPLLDFLLSFRYPLAGECAFVREVAEVVRPGGGWSLEIGQLCEVFRTLDPREVCQVDGGTGYDHKHQPADGALEAMAAEIAAELFRQCSLEGLPSDGAYRAAVAGAYRREAELALSRSASLALFNRLPFDEGAERAIVELFAARLGALAAGAGQ